MKKTIVTLALVAAVGITGMGLAEARWGGGGGGGGGWMMGGGGGYGYGPGYCNGPGNWDKSAPIDYEARQQFRKDTAELREQIFEKRHEYTEVVRQENPDKELAKQLWSELFDLQNEMREKAQTAGMMKFGSKK